MIPRPFHGYDPGSADRVALVRVEPAADHDRHLVQVLRGPQRAKLRLVATLGPFSDEDLHLRFAAAVDELRHEGYWPGGVLALLEALDNPNAGVRARAALRLGWRRCRDAVDKLLAKLPGSVDDCCSILDALGMIGDARAVPAVREYGERKLLSRRRSATEALRELGDADGLQQAQRRAVERLPANLRAALDSGTAAQIGEVFLSLDVQQQAVALDTLYELEPQDALDDGAVVAAVRLILTKIHFGQAYLWRAVKSVFKRALLRQDLATFGQLAHAIEVQGRGNKGTSAHVKSGYDGNVRQTAIFSRTTQNYLRGLSWRYLRDIARYRAEAYSAAAAEALIPYTDEYLHKHFTHNCYLLHQILLGRSKRFVFEGRRLRFRRRGPHKPPAGLREEQYPELWDAYPRAYLRLLAAGQCSDVQAFAVNAVKSRHPQLLRDAVDAEVLAMLGAPYEPTIELALAELDRRFSADSPDWNLLRRMLDDERPLARTLGQRWLRLTGHLWLRDADRIIDFLGVRQPNIRALVVELTVSAAQQDPGLRQALAERIVALLRAPEPVEGAHDGYAAVASQALAAELAALVSVAELADWIANGPDTVKVAAGELLRQRPDAVRELGLERLTALADHELATVRTAAHTLLQSAASMLRTDPSVLFVLVESRWEDTRDLAFGLLRDKIDLSALGLDGMMGLLDSNRTDVQDLGKELTQKHLKALPADELVFRLVQHPHANLRQFALDLAVQYLPENSQSLAQLRNFCRAALLDLWPNRRVKQAAFDFLAARGAEDAGQAEIAAGILGDLVRSRTRADAECALEALVRIKLAQPEVPSTVELLPGGVQ